jgi:virulence-associated protein VapD
VAGNINIQSLGTQILSAAEKTGGDTWAKIQQASRLYVNGYVQALADISQAIASGDISKKEGTTYAKNAAFMFEMQIANVTEVTLNQIQTFMNSVMKLAKGAINKALPIPIL